MRLEKLHNETKKTLAVTEDMAMNWDDYLTEEPLFNHAIQEDFKSFHMCIFLLNYNFQDEDNYNNQQVWEIIETATHHLLEINKMIELAYINDLLQETQYNFLKVKFFEKLRDMMKFIAINANQYKPRPEPNFEEFFAS